jgi:lactoylglutathione lyase
MNSFTFDHIALSVRDVAKSVRFYQHVFDLTEIENTAAKSATRWLSLGEGKELHLIPRPEAEIKTNKAVHFALTTARFDAFIQKLIKLEIPYSDWPNSPNKDYVRNDGIRQVYFQDPNGYWIEVNDATAHLIRTTR